MQLNMCPECHAPLESGKECVDYFNQMLAWDFADFKNAGKVHHLTVLCYYLQHPAKYSQEGLKEALQILKDIVDKKLSIEGLYKKESDVFSSDKRDWKVEGTIENHGSYSHPVTWSKTAADIVKNGVEEYPENVEQWAKAIYTDLKRSGELD